MIMNKAMNYIIVSKHINNVKFSLFYLKNTFSQNTVTIMLLALRSLLL